MNVRRLLPLLIGVLLLFALPAIVSAQPAAHQFAGRATLDGAAASDGTIVTAWLDGNQEGSATVSNGFYNMIVAADPGESFAGEIVSFQIGGYDAAETGIWGEESESPDGLTNLTASSAMVMEPTATIATAFAGASQHLVDSRGLTVYLFTVDTQGSNSSACGSEFECLTTWPPVFTGADPVASGTADQSLLGSFERADGLGTQVTYNGWPLYYFWEDVAPGDIAGQGVFDVWWIVSISGEGITDLVRAAPGAAGARGARGPAGPSGADGSTGAQGDSGPAGSAGSDGSAGAQGDSGPAGSAGAAGDTGASGSTGPAGATGSDGASGDDGSSGALAIVGLILAIIALVGAGGVIVLSRRT